MWYNTASTGMTEEGINKQLKQLIRTSPFFIQMFKEKGIPIDRIEQLKFKIKDLKDKHAEANGEEIDLNKKLFENGDFFPDKVHFVVHEINHWLTRQAEKECYFADPEEISGFCEGIFYELARGQTPQQIFDIFFPIVSDHFDDKNYAKSFYDSLFQQARARSARIGVQGVFPK